MQETLLHPNNKLLNQYFDVVRRGLENKGMKGTRAIKDSLLLTDYSQRGFLDRWQFEDALNYAGAFTTGDQISAFMSHYNKDGDATFIIYQDFYQDLIQPLNDTRENLIKKVFNDLSKGTMQPVPLKVIFQRYCPEKHPFVLSGDITPEEVMMNLHKDMEDFSDDGTTISYRNWEAYYRDIGSSVITDKSFISLVTGTWDVKSDLNPVIHDRIRYLNEILISKVEQRCQPTENRKNNIMSICKFYDTGLKDALTKDEFNGLCHNYGIILEEDDLNIFFNAHVDPATGMVPYRRHPNAFLDKLWAEYNIQ